MKTLTIFIYIVLGTMYVNFSFATSYIWLGATSTAWGTSTNWSPTGVPVAGDNVTIVTRTNQPTYNGVAGVTNFTMTSGTLNLNGYTLNISGIAAFNSGTINNGKISVNSTTSLTIAGTLFNCKFMSLTNSFALNGSTFNDSTFITRKASGGTGATSSAGGNKFHGYTEITNKSAGNIYLNNGTTVHADTAFEDIVFNMDSIGTLSFGHAGTETSTFYGKVYLKRKAGSGTSTMYIASSGKVKFYDEVIMSNLSTGGYIYFGNNSGSSVTFTSMAKLKVDVSGIGGATVYLKYFTKDNNLPTYLDFSSTGKISIGPASTIDGTFDFTGKEFYLNGCTFNRQIEFISNSTSSISSSGGNVFNDNVSIINNGTGSIQLATSLGDDFNHDVVFTRGVGSGIIYPAYAKVNYFAGSITANGEGGVIFGQGSSANMSILDGSFQQEMSGSGTTIRFKKLKLNKSGSAGVFLSHNINVTDSLMLTSGILETKTFTVELNDNCKATGASNSSHIDGKVKKTGNDAFTFPVGMNGFYRSIDISAPSSTTDAFTAEYFNQNSNSTYSHSSKDAGLNALSTGEYWKLDRNTGSSNISVTLSWDTVGPSCSFASAANLKVASWNGTTWKDKGNGGTTGTRAAGTIVTNGTSTTYGAYTLATSSTFYCVPCQAYAGPDSIITIYYGDTVQLGQTNPGGYTYSWSPTTNLSASNISNPLASPKTDIIYTLQATNSKGCVAKDIATVKGLPPCIQSGDYVLAGNTVWSGGNFIGGVVPVAHTPVANYLNGARIFISGTLTIEEDILISACDLIMDKGSKIIINQNCTISDFTYIHACWDQMWDGIILNEGAHLIFDDQARVEEAKTGIFVDGGTFLFWHAMFNKNQRNLYILGDSYSYAPGYILESYFMCEDYNTGVYQTLLNPFAGERTEFGIELEGKMNLTIGYENWFRNLDFGINAHDGPLMTVSNGNKFRHLNNGVWGRRLSNAAVTNNNIFNDITNEAVFFNQIHNSTITVDGNTFNSPSTGAAIGTGIALIDNLLTTKTVTNNVMNFMDNTANTGTGIIVSQGLPFAETAEISNNTISNAFMGIHTNLLFGAADFTEGTSTVNIDNNTITNESSLNTGEAGILSQFSRNNVVSRNIVTQASNTTNWNETGIREELGTTNWLSCNKTDYIGRGLFITGDVRPFNLLIKNEMKDNQTGLFLNWAKTGDQGFLGIPFDNQWTGTWTGDYHTVTYGDDANGNLSPFLVHTGGTYQPVNNSNFSNAPFPISVTTTSNYWSGDACPVIHQFLMPSTDRKSLVAGIINESTVTATRGKNLQWMGLYGIYKNIQEDNILLESATVDNFYDSCFVSNMGKLDRAIAGYAKYAPGEEEDYQDTLSAISTVNNTEAKIKAVLQILYNNLVNAVDTFSTAQIDDLIDIAELCPYDYGFGVYMARSLLMEVNPSIRYYNACEATPAPPGGKWDGEENENNTIEADTNEWFLLYPNPANNLLVLEYMISGDEEINAIFELYDLSGRKVKVQNISTNRTIIETNDLDAGMYHYALRKGESIKYSGKQIIIK